MARIVTTHYRYERPPRKRKAQAATIALVIVRAGKKAPVAPLSPWSAPMATEPMTVIGNMTCLTIPAALSTIVTPTIVRFESLQFSSDACLTSTPLFLGPSLGASVSISARDLCRTTPSASCSRRNRLGADRYPGAESLD